MARFATVMCLAVVEAVSPGSCHIKVQDGKALCVGSCTAGYACGNGPSGCGCLKSNDPCGSLQTSLNGTEPGSCHLTVVEGKTCCSGRCKSGYACGNGPSGCGCLESDAPKLSEPGSPGSCHIKVRDGKALCQGKCKSGYACGNGPSGCGCLKSDAPKLSEPGSPGSCHIKVKDGKALCLGNCKSGYACGNGPSGCGCLKSDEPQVGEPGSCHIKVENGQVGCFGKCKSGYACGNGPSGCGCLKSDDPCASVQTNLNATEPGSCHVTVVQGKACCSGRCSSSGSHCANGPSGCGCIPMVVV